MTSKIDTASMEESNLDDDMLDIDFISSQSSTSSSQSARRAGLTSANVEVLKYIDTTLDNVMSALTTDQNPSIALKRIGSLRGPSHGNSTRDDTEISGNAQRRARAGAEQGSTIYSWPGKTEGEAFRFACLLAILVEVKKAIETDITITKRDIYYRQPDLYKKQETVDRFIDDLAHNCNVTRKDLRVTASPKGLLCGLTSTNEVLIVPEDPIIINMSTMLHLKWILVVEKEATFKSLIEHNFHKSPSLGHGLIVTGKGYPDLNTKGFLRYVLDTAPRQLPIVGLFDGDPDGLDIFRCYRLGSKRSGQEASSNIPGTRWLGVDIAEFLKDPSVMNDAVTMTSRDRIRATNMLGKKGAETCNRQRQPDVDAVKQRKMLQYMLMLNVKMEIQAIDKIEGGLCDWLTKKMVTL